MSAATQPEQLQVDLDGLVLDVRVWGPEDGVPVLALHGFPQTSTSWSGVAARLAEDPVGRGLRLVAPDQRGYSPGARPVETAAYAVERLADDALGIAAALGHETVHLTGHDWGACVAWWLAAYRPERVRSLTACAIPHLAAFGDALAHDPDQRERSAYIRTFRRPGEGEEMLLGDDAAGLRSLFGGRVGGAAVEHDVAVMRDGAMTPALQWYRAMGDMSDTPVVTVPTTYVWGEEDTACGPVAAHGCADHVSGDYRFVPLPGVSHWSLDESPGDVADALVARVGSVPGPRRS